MCKKGGESVALHRNLQRMREANGLRQHEVSAALGLTRAAYANYETGIRSPKPDTLRQLARIYHVSVDALLGEETGAGERERTLLAQYRLLTPETQAHFLKLVELEAALEEKRQAETADGRFTRRPGLPS